MNWIAGWDREQRHFLPECVEDYVQEDNPVRFLDAFVDGLDLQALGFKFPKDQVQGRGRPAYHPTSLLKLYLYGYSRQLRSSRRLEEQCQCNLEVIWLMSKLTPDHKTIADFRKDNAEALKGVIRQFNKLCQDLDLFDGELIAIDGCKVKGQNNPAKNWSAAKLEKQAKQLDERMEKYLAALEEADAQGSEPAQPRALSAAQLKEKIAELARRQEVVAQRQQQLAQSDQSQLSLSDPESVGMKGAHGHVVGYNVQGAVDAKHHLLVVAQVTNAPVDYGQLATVAQAAKQELGVEGLAAVADGGYYVSQDIKECQEQGIEVHVPGQNNSANERAGLFGREQFAYDAATDSYVCPAGQRLEQRAQSEDKGRRMFEYYDRKACEGCPMKSQCTPGAYRKMSRWEYQECLERMEREMAAHPEVGRRRKELIEHCWGSLKWLLPGGFLLKGLEKVQTEVSLVHFAYNLKRALKVVGLAGLMAGLRRRQAGLAGG